MKFTKRSKTKFIFDYTLVDEDYYKGVTETEGYIERMMDKVHEVLRIVFQRMFFVTIDDNIFLTIFHDDEKNSELAVYIDMRAEHYNSFLGKYVSEQEMQLLLELIFTLDEEFEKINWIVVGLGV